MTGVRLGMGGRSVCVCVVGGGVVFESLRGCTI